LLRSILFRQIIFITAAFSSSQLIWF